MHPERDLVVLTAAPSACSRLGRLSAVLDHQVFTHMTKEQIHAAVAMVDRNDDGHLSKSGQSPRPMVACWCSTALTRRCRVSQSATYCLGSQTSAAFAKASTPVSAGDCLGERNAH